MRLDDVLAWVGMGMLIAGASACLYSIAAREDPAAWPILSAIVSGVVFYRVGKASRK